MIATRSKPVALTIVAVLFVLCGLGAAIEVVVSLLHNQIEFNFGVLGLFIGPGLLRFTRGWRTCGLVFLWIALIGAPIAALVFLNHPGPLNFTLFGREAGHAPKSFGVIAAVAMFLLALWQYRVLTRPDIRSLFGLTPDTPGAHMGGGQSDPE